MTRIADALKLAEETLSMLEMEGSRLTPIVLRCLRLARLLGHVSPENWFRLELRGYRTNVLGHDDWGLFAAWSGRESGKTEEGQQLYWTVPIEVIETDLEVAREELRTFHTPTSLTSIPEPSAESPQYYWLRGQTATERVIASIRTQRTAMAARVRRQSEVVACLRGAMQEWLSRVVVELRYGAIVDTAFHRMKERFDAFLVTHAPDTARALAAAFARADSSDPEEWSQGLTSCRRALKALANRLYPPTDKCPSGHDLSEESYKNRLIQFASEHLASGSQRDLLVAEVESVASRADALNKLASKGVHSEVDETEVELTVVHTYLLAGELLGLAPQQGDTSVHAAAPHVDDQLAPTDAAPSVEGDDNPPLAAPSEN